MNSCFFYWLSQYTFILYFDRVFHFSLYLYIYSCFNRSKFSSFIYVINDNNVDQSKNISYSSSIKILRTHLHLNLIHHRNLLHFYDFLSIVYNVQLILLKISLIYLMIRILIDVIVELLVSKLKRNQF